MKNTRRQAFTLIELLVVILIMAVMASAVVPAYNRFLARTRFDSTVVEVQDILNYARQRAIETDTTTTVHYEAQNEAFVVESTAPPAATDQPAAFATDTTAASANGVSATTQRTVQLGNDYQVTGFQMNPPATSSGTSTQPQSNGDDVMFHGDGTTDGGEFVLRNVAGYAIRFQVWAATGRVTLDDVSGR